jgi:hypothetical protein
MDEKAQKIVEEIKEANAEREQAEYDAECAVGMDRLTPEEIEAGIRAARENSNAFEVVIFPKPNPTDGETVRP